VRDRAILETFYSTGIRRLEVAGLRVWDVDLEQNTLTIPQSEGNKDRHLPVHRIRRVGPGDQRDADDQLASLHVSGGLQPGQRSEIAGVPVWDPCASLKKLMDYARKIGDSKTFEAEKVTWKRFCRKN